MTIQPDLQKQKGRGHQKPYSPLITCDEFNNISLTHLYVCMRCIRHNLKA
jgi:hypothetical protein